MLRNEVRQFLRAHGVRLSKKLGQHFLVNEHALQKIIAAANIKPNDHVVEIGAGLGILTRELLKTGARVTTIEIDENLIPLIQEFVSISYKLQAKSSLDIIHNDALQTPLPQHPYKIVANIPYQITSPLLKHVFVASKTIPLSLTILIQREVADKICDKKDAGRLSILVGLFGAPSIVAIVPSSSFLPPPKVESAVLHIESFKKPKAPPEIIERVFSLTKKAFGQKRKMLRNTIDLSILEKAKIDQSRRPQTLSIEEWIRIAGC